MCWGDAGNEPCADSMDDNERGRGSCDEICGEDDDADADGQHAAVDGIAPGTVEFISLFKWWKTLANDSAEGGNEDCGECGAVRGDEVEHAVSESNDDNNKADAGACCGD
mmetsp:Transcript_39083/g.107696  ORF Transcript_39083/g.107696 Transcript_39083/m.107696 type:complete len:110 (-) Transcript_39083:614-943(-)